MDAIKSYISTLLVVAVSAGAINILAPDGNIKKYIKYLISLSVVIILMLPFKDLIYTLPQLLESYEVKFDDIDLSASTSAEDLVIGYSLKEVKHSIVSMVSNRFMIAINDVDIEYNADDYENVEITKIIVYTDCNDLFASDIKQYLDNMMYCEIEVVNDG